MFACVWAVLLQVMVATSLSLREQRLIATVLVDGFLSRQELAARAATCSSVVARVPSLLAAIACCAVVAVPQCPAAMSTSSRQTVVHLGPVAVCRCALAHPLRVRAGLSPWSLVLHPAVQAVRSRLALALGLMVLVEVCRCWLAARWIQLAQEAVFRSPAGKALVLAVMSMYVLVRGGKSAVALFAFTAVRVQCLVPADQLMSVHRLHALAAVVPSVCQAVLLVLGVLGRHRSAPAWHVVGAPVLSPLQSDNPAAAPGAVSRLLLVTHRLRIRTAALFALLPVALRGRLEAKAELLSFAPGPVH
jgi:hypothetical protein